MFLFFFFCRFLKFHKGENNNIIYKSHKGDNNIRVLSVFKTLLCEVVKTGCFRRVYHQMSCH